eukprot:scaffold105325_cov31-Tisochrysis_lutea.AAC.3
MQHEHHVLLHLWEAEGFQLEPVPSWRMRERIKTSSLVLVLALNLGVDPPDVIKPNPCARLEYACYITRRSEGLTCFACVRRRRRADAAPNFVRVATCACNPRSPCRCWIDPQVGQKAIDAIAKALQARSLARRQPRLFWTGRPVKLLRSC